MIVGRGDIAKVLGPVDRKDLIFFASGVSNSRETRESEYKREVDLLLEQDKSKKLVYFSSLCVFYSKSRYASHKKHMEDLIKENFPKYIVLRLGNITWGNNTHTLINFFKHKIKKGEDFEVKNTYRYLIDKDELLHWLKMIPEWNCEMNITGKRMKVSAIIRDIKKGLL